MPKRKSYKKKLPKYSNGGPPVNGKHQADILNAKTYLTSMANSPLFAERYQKMTGETNPEVIERARQNILSNISNTGIDYISPFAMQMRGSKGFMDYDKNKLFLSERIKNKDLTASDILTHELSHGSLPMPNPDDIQQNKLSDPRFGNIINLNQYAKLKKQYEQQFSPFVDGKPNERFTKEFRGTPGIFERRDAFILAGNRGNLSSYEDEMANQFFNYLTDPTEIKSRVDVGRRFLKDKGLYDPTTQRFTDKDYDNLKKEFENLPRKQHKEKYESYGDIFDLLYNYPKEDVINMFNSFVSNKPDTNTNLNINQAKHGGYIHTNMAGKINKRKGLPTNFPRYNGGGYGVGSAALTGALNSTLGPTSGNFNWLSLAPSAMSLARSFQQPQGEMDYGTNEYFQDRNRQAGQVAAGNQLLTTGLNMVAPGAGTAVQLLGTVGNLAANKDQYGVASTGAGAVVEDILNPVQKFANVGEELKKGDIKQAFLEGLPGYGGIAQRKQAMGEVNSLYNKFTTQRTSDQQDAYTQNVKAAEGQYLAYGGYMPYYALGGRARYFNGGRMVNPYNKEPNAEIENEVVNHADGGIQDFSHLPRHENATEKNLVSMEDGSFVFSNRIKNPATGNYFAKDAKPLNTSQQEKILADGNTTPLTKNSAKLMFSTKKILADRLAELHEATKTYNGAQKAENEATEEFIGMLGGMYGKGGLIKRKDGSYSPRGLWDNIRANRGSGKKPTKAMLEQERKIKAKYDVGGNVDGDPPYNNYITQRDATSKGYKKIPSIKELNQQEQVKKKKDLYNLQLRKRLDVLKHDADSIMKSEISPFKLMGIRKEADSILQYLQQNAPELAKPEMLTNKAAGKTLITGSKYLIPELIPIVEPIESGINIIETATDPNISNIAGSGIDYLGWKNNNPRTKNIYNKIGDIQTASEIYNINQQAKEARKNINQKLKNANIKAYGGYALGESYDLSDAEIKELKKQGYTFDIE